MIIPWLNHKIVIPMLLQKTKDTVFFSSPRPKYVCTSKEWMEPVYTGNTHTPTAFFRCWEIIKQCKCFFRSLSLNPKSFKNIYSRLGKHSKLICFTFSCMIPSCPCEYCSLACTATVIKRHLHEHHLPEVATQGCYPFLPLLK